MSERTNFGLDAPAVVRNMVIGGIAGSAAGWLLLHDWKAGDAIWRQAIGSPLLSIGIWFIISGLLMVLSSMYGKAIAARRLVDRLHLQGGETLLDVGCGHGLMLVTAARRLPNGRAIGVDLWSQIDQKDNSAVATLANALAAGVADRVEVRDGDMRSLPVDDSSIDAVVSSLAIHNLSSRAERATAIAEIVRVLKPGGQVAIMDIWNVHTYRGELRKLGMIEVHTGLPSAFIFPPCRYVTARKRDS